MTLSEDNRQPERDRQCENWTDIVHNFIYQPHLACSVLYFYMLINQHMHVLIPMQWYTGGCRCDRRLDDH